MKNENLSVICGIIFICGIILGAVTYHSYFEPKVSNHYDTTYTDRWHNAKPSPPDTEWFDQDTAYVADSSAILKAIHQTHNEDSLLYWMMTPWGSFHDTTITYQVKDDTNKIVMAIHSVIISYPSRKENELIQTLDSIKLPERTIKDVRIIEKTDWQKTTIAGIVIAGIFEGIKAIAHK